MTDFHKVFTVARKASAAAIVAAAAAVTEAAPGGLTAGEWVVVGVAAAVAYVTVYWTSNAAGASDAVGKIDKGGRHLAEPGGSE